MGQFSVKISAPTGSILSGIQQIHNWKFNLGGCAFGIDMRLLSGTASWQPNDAIISACPEPQLSARLANCARAATLASRIRSRAVKLGAREISAPQSVMLPAYAIPPLIWE